MQGNISRMALNFPVQGSSSEISKLACIYVFDYLINNNLIGVVKFSNVVHDELLLECPKDMAETISKMIIDCMVRAGNIYCKTIPLKAECKISKFWNH
jgi:DNA polymerase-1